LRIGPAFLLMGRFLLQAQLLLPGVATRLQTLYTGAGFAAETYNA